MEISKFTCDRISYRKTFNQRHPMSMIIGYHLGSHDQHTQCHLSVWVDLCMIIDQNRIIIISKDEH